VTEDVARERLGLGFGGLLSQANAYIDKAEALREQLALVEAKDKKDLNLEEEKKKEELAQLVLIFTNQETALDQEISSLRQTEKEIKKRIFDKGQLYTDLESKVLPLRTKRVELEKEIEVAKAKIAKLEERATNREVQLGRVEAEFTQQAKNFKKAEAELIEDAIDAYVAGFEDALAQVACVYPEMDASPFATSNCVMDGQIVPRVLPS